MNEEVPNAQRDPSLAAYLRKYSLPLALIIILTVSAYFKIQAADNAIRDEARGRFFELYTRQQYLVAQLTAQSLDDMFATFHRHLDLAVSLFDGQEVDRKRAAQAKGELRKIYDSLAGTPVIDLAVFDRNGTVVAMEPADPYTLGHNYAWREYYQWVKAKEPGRMYISPWMKLEGGKNRGVKELIVAEGIFSPRGEFRGLVTFAINFDDVALKHIVGVKMGKQGHAWLVDSSNETVLVDPNGRMAGDRFESLRQRWPRLYGLLKKTQDATPASGWYDVEDPDAPEQQVRKLVSYHPVRLENRLWTVGVATPAREVEALLSPFLQRQEAISTTLLVTILSGAGLLLILLFNWNRSLATQVCVHTRALFEAHTRLESTFDELLMAKKAAAVGHLALGLAHEIRNPLSAIQMNMQMIRKKIHPSGVLYENFSIADGEIQRLNRLLKDVMDFARPRPLRLQEAEVAEMVRRLLQLVWQRLRECSVDADADIEPGLLLVCDPEQIHQVLLNLVLNGLESMEQGEGERRLRIAASSGSGQAFISISDTGAGIPAGKREQLFDPFYTTKASTGGLGLSIVQTIVLQHGGSISVDSEPGLGATFTVMLPLQGPSAQGEQH
jgi:two-component system, NtrC family, C4-dicarboxylate transport sensor histidine kinase DctB